jgi:hypothetical protein
VAGDADGYLAVARGRQLADLRWHWGDAYEITWAGRFHAWRRDDGAVLSARSSEELRELIRCDYGHRPVARRFG